MNHKKPFTSSEKYYQMIEEDAEMRKPVSGFQRAAFWIMFGVMILGVYFLIQDLKGERTNERPTNEPPGITRHTATG